MEFMEEMLDQPLRAVLPRMQERIMDKTSYFGVKALKNPCDAWVYQELIHEIRPDFIVEIGNAYGGGTLMLAHLCDLLRHGHVLGVDLSHAHIPAIVRQHPRVTLVEGDAVGSFATVRALVPLGAKVLVIEDSCHSHANTLAVLRAYGALVHVGGYFIVEDGICHHGLDLGPRPGPYEAVTDFLAENSAFVLDRSRESFVITWNPKGFLKKTSA